MADDNKPTLLVVEERCPRITPVCRAGRWRAAVMTGTDSDEALDL